MFHLEFKFKEFHDGLVTSIRLCKFAKQIGVNLYTVKLIEHDSDKNRIACPPTAGVWFNEKPRLLVSNEQCWSTVDGEQRKEVILNFQKI